MSGTNPRRLAAALIVGAGAIAAGGYWLYQTLRLPEPTEALAPLRPCGPELAPAADAAPDPLADARGGPAAAAVRRALGAVPPVVRQALVAKHYTVSVVDAAEVPSSCATATPGMLPALAVCSSDAAGDSTGEPSSRRLQIGLPKPAITDPDWAARGVALALIPVLTHAFVDEVWAQTLGNLPVPAGQISAPAALHALRRQLAEALRSEAGDDIDMERRFGRLWTDVPAAVDRALLYATDAFYCSPASRAKLHQLHGRAEALYARTFQCILGRPWYAGARDYDAACPTAH